MASATVRARSWTHFADDAWWRGTRFTHESYMEFLRRSGYPIPILFMAAVGVIGLRLCNVSIDVLHCVDLGIAAHIEGSVFWYIFVIRRKCGGRTQAECVKLLEDHMQAWYKRTKCKSRIQGKVTVERLRTAKLWPKLKSKGAAARHLAVFAMQLMLDFGDPLDPVWGWHDLLATGVTQLLVEFYNLIADESQFLTAAAKLRIAEIGDQLTKLYDEMAMMFYDLGDQALET